LVANREIFIPHLHLEPPQKTTRRNFAKMFDNHKTRMIGLPCGEKTITIFSVVFTEYEDATDEKTDR